MNKLQNNKSDLRVSPYASAGVPEQSGLYNAAKEHDSCGIGFIANMKNKKSHDIIVQGLQILDNLEHRGAVGADPKAGDGCGILLQIPLLIAIQKRVRA